MASSPKYKVYRDGKYVAACKFAEDAAAICGMGGERVQVKLNHRDVVYDHEADGRVAENSWDEAAVIIHCNEASLCGYLPGEK